MTGKPIASAMLCAALAGCGTLHDIPKIAEPVRVSADYEATGQIGQTTAFVGFEVQWNGKPG